METFIFKFGQDEFICEARSKQLAQYEADSFIAKNRSIADPYGWIADSEGKNIFRISMGA